MGTRAWGDGVTYKAEDTNLRTNVTLKVINLFYLHDATARERFIREARAAASLRHRNVAAVYHLGNDEQSYSGRQRRISYLGWFNEDVPPA